MKVTIQQGIILLTAFLFSGCGLLENEQDFLLQCTEKDLSNELIHIGVNTGYDSYISALNPENLKESYRIKMERGAPFQIHYSGDKLYYTVDITDSQSVFEKRTLEDGTLLDSILVPKGASLFQLYGDVYISYAAYPNTFILDNNRIVYQEYDHIIQPIQKTESRNYAIYGDLNEIFFGSVDTTGLSDITNLTSLIREVVPNYSFVYGMYYLEKENRLLMTIEDRNRPPITKFFDINIGKGIYKSILTGQHANIIPSENRMFYFLTHASSLRPNSEPTRHLTIYDVSKKRMINLIDFHKEFGANIYIEDITSDGCSLYAGISLKNSDSMIIKYSMKTKTIDTVKKVGNGASRITAMTLTSNPKLNGELK